VSPNEDLHTITSGDVEEITDTGSQNFIDELSEKGEKISYYKLLGIFPLIISFGLLLYFFFFYTTQEKINNRVIDTRTLIKSAQKVKINVRNTIGKKSLPIGVMGTQGYELLSDSNHEWYKINYNGHEGYVSKKLTKKEDKVSTHEEYSFQESPTLFETQKSSFFTVLVCFLIFFFFLLRYLYRADKKRLTIAIHYDMDDKVKEVYQQFVHHFSAILSCSRVWQYLHAQATYDYKYTSGASELVRRIPLLRMSSNKKPLRHLETNIEIPYLGLAKTQLYFFPERVIIKKKGGYGGIMYKNVETLGETIRFIETGSVPSDSVVVDYTWRFLNKDGGPDRRFNNNYQIPICQYSTYSFRSDSGLNEQISTSKVDALNEFIGYIKAIGELQNNMPVNQVY